MLRHIDKRESLMDVIFYSVRLSLFYSTLAQVMNPQGCLELSMKTKKQMASEVHWMIPYHVRS